MINKYNIIETPSYIKIDDILVDGLDISKTDKYKVISVERIYPKSRFDNSKVVVAKKILKSGKLGKTTIAFDTKNLLKSFHKYKN